MKKIYFWTLLIALILLVVVQICGLFNIVSMSIGRGAFTVSLILYSTYLLAGKEWLTKDKE
jgi:uncharacterized membrane protein